MLVQMEFRRRHVEKGFCRGNGQAFFFVNFGAKKWGPGVLSLSPILLFSMENNIK